MEAAYNSQSNNLNKVGKRKLGNVARGPRDSTISVHFSIGRDRDNTIPSTPRADG